MSKYAKDVRWRVGLIVAVFGVVLTVTGFISFNLDLLTALVNGALNHNISPASVFVAPFDPGNVWFYVILLSVFISVLWVGSSRARLRMRQRALAFAGDQNAIPRANTDAAGIAERAPAEEASGWTLACESLRLSWREPNHTRRGWSLLAVGCLGLPAVLAISGLALWAAILIARFLAVSLAGNLFFVVLVGPFLILIISAIIWLRYLRRLASAPPIPARTENDVIADSVGLAWRRPGKKDVALRWADARLLEVALTFAGRDSLAWRVYTLWGADERSVSWPVFNVGADQPQLDAADEPARVALAQASHDLLRLIHERAGLTSRTFDPGLLADARQARPWFATVITNSSVAPFGWLVAIIYFAIWPLSGGLVAPFLPLTSVAWLNIYASVSLLIVGLVCARTMLRWRRAGRRLPEEIAQRALGALPTAPSSVDADALFTLGQRPSLTTTLAIWLLAPMCVLDGVVALVAIIMPGSHFAGQTLGATLVYTTNFMLVVTMLGGVVGLIIGIGYVGPRRLLASSERLSVGREGAADPETSILWPKVTAVIAITQRDGVVTGYRVKGAGNDEISWRRSARSLITTPSPRPLLQRAIPITPDELAALVIARAGLQLEVCEA